MIPALFSCRFPVTRAIALVLLLLAASPLTAPFSTVDLGPVGSTAPVLDSAKSKAATDDALPVPLGVLTAVAHDIRSRSLARTANPHQTRHAQHAVLRL